MKKVKFNRKEISLKFVAVAVAAMIIISSVTMIEVMIKAIPEDEAEPSFVDQSFQTRPCEVSSVLAQGGLWVSFDSSAPGTPAEAHVTVSDTSGITIVADFYGFWRNNFTINGTEYDDLEMPGATSIHDIEKPMLPVLSEFVEIPHDIDVSIELIASSSDNASGYFIRPVSPPQVPIGLGEPRINASSTISPLPTVLDPVYSNNAFFPGNTTGIEGGDSAASLIMRGHRLLGLNLYPVQYNPATNDMIVYSQLVVKVKYSIPAQIEPIPESLRSEAFERIMSNFLLNYDLCNIQSPPMNGITNSTFTSDPPPPGYVEGAEYLIITNDVLKPQADRLAVWKERKGVPSAVITVDPIVSDIKDEISDAYTYWYPAPTYVLLFGDVDDIPANYDLDHLAKVDPPGLFNLPKRFYEPGYGWIASDLGYFDIEGQEYFPDMIYGRISVDTVDQARIIVDKILQYEQSPPAKSSFYNSILSAGQFQDTKDLFGSHTGNEDADFPFIYHLEIIRHYLEDIHEYTVHINYSCSGLHKMPVKFCKEIEESRLVSVSDLATYDWLWAYNDPIDWRCARENITKSINDGRFLAVYYGHGGSKNNNYRFDANGDGRYDSNDRGIVEGWLTPFFNTTYAIDSTVYSYFAELLNEENTSLIVSIACNTGWYDGEKDQLHMHNTDLSSNPYADYENECFAEEIIRLEGGGAVAAISASRVAYSEIGGYLLDGIIHAFWPGFLESVNQPIYDMGTALLFGKLYAAKQWGSLHDDYEVARTTFEEYHLFGDPETQLWTDTPTWINVSSPDSVGTSNPQRFAVTVIDGRTGDPIKFARVCIQQGDDVYEVGYTDPNGQAIFDVDPVANPSHLNVTVTKHNVRPHISTIDVIDSEASISVSPNPILGDDILTITFNEFLADTSKIILINGYNLASLGPGITEHHWQVWPGPTRFLNVRVWSSTGVSVDRFQRVASDEGPDPYIYSQNDPRTWDPGGVVWDNPDIIIKRGGVQIFSMTQNEVHDIEVMVHNRGIIPADSTTVTFWYAPFVGSVSWTYVGEYTVAPTQVMSDTAYFTLNPPLPHSACLKVILSHPEEREANYINNIGYECTDVIEMSSPGEGSLQVGNPTGSTGYVFIKVKQPGDYEDVWNATIRGYSSQEMGVGANESITLFVDPIADIGPDEWRLFTVEICVNYEKVGGMVFNVTSAAPPTPIPLRDVIMWIIMIGGGIAVIAICIVIVRRR